MPQKIGIWKCSFNTAVSLHQNPGQVLLFIASVTSLLNTRSHSKMTILWREPFSRQQIAFLNTSKIEHRSWKSLKKRNFRAQYKAAERMAMYGEEQLRKFINACECLFLPLWRVDWYVTHLSLFIRMFYEDMTAKEVLLTSLPRHTREEDIFNVFVGFVKETKLPLSNWCWWHATKVKSVFDLENPALGGKGVMRGAREKQFPGIRITVGGAGKSQQCHK